MKPERNIIRVTCEAANLIPLEELVDFQGGIKRITAANLEKLKSRILRDGINVPVFVWIHDDVNHILDGHQRRAALLSLEADGYDIPPIPVAYIEAVDEADARQKLLGITSQYGNFDTDELESWLRGVDESVVETLRLVDSQVNIDAILDTGEEEDPENGEGPNLQPQTIECPECGHHFSVLREER